MDLAPYGKTQRFRMLGAEKSGWAPLRHVTVWELANSASQWTQSGATSKAAPPSVVINIIPFFFRRPPAFYSGNYPRPAGLREYSMRYTAARSASSFQGTGVSRTAASGKAADLACKMTEGAREPHKRGRLARDIEPSSTIRSDVEKWMLENFEVVPMHELIPGQVVLHEACEGLDGTPSAIVGHGHDNNRLVYCFSCNTAIFEIPTWCPEPLLLQPDEIVQSPHPFLNYDGRIDVDLRSGKKWTILDAGMGSRKTRALEVDIQQTHSSESYACILPLMTSYDEEGAFDGEGSHNLATTVDSIVKIPNGHVGGMTPAHLLSSTIAGRIHDVLGKLEDFINTADRVALCQHDLNMSDMLFWLSFIGTDYFNWKEVYVRKMITLSKLPTLTYSPNINWVYHRIKNHYRDNYDDVTQVQKEPTIIFCTCLNLVRILEAYLKSIARNEIAKVESECYILVYRARSGIRPLWSSRMRKHRSRSQYREALHHCFLHVPPRERDPWDGGANGRRLRERPGLYHTSYAYIQAGKSGSRNASETALFRATKSMLRPPDAGSQWVSAMLEQPWAEGKAERHDTYNRHEYLWKQLYSNVAPGRLHDMERPPEAELKEVVAAIRAIADDEDANELNFLTDLVYALSVKATVDYFPLLVGPEMRSRLRLAVSYVAAISKKEGHLFAHSTATIFGPAFSLARFLDLILSTSLPASALRLETHWAKPTHAHHPNLRLGVDSTRMSTYVVGELFPGKLIEGRMDDITWNSAGGFDEVALLIDQRSSKHTYNKEKTGHVLLKQHLDHLGLASRATRTRVKDLRPNMSHSCVATYKIDTDALKDTVGLVVLMMTDSHIAAMRELPGWTALFDGTEAHIAERVREALDEGEEDDSQAPTPQRPQLLLQFDGNGGEDDEEEELSGDEENHRTDMLSLLSPARHLDMPPSPSSEPLNYPPPPVIPLIGNGWVDAEKVKENAREAEPEEERAMDGGIRTFLRRTFGGG
ncbi:hypothetical protein BDK51DRAFT_25748 [Blyttiomyces helicus]|uniref:Uncharacterized protein n=1 Tax=Blyttiomyces helicus TaxID=388810 RepID=A0A4P9WGD9_9FUNG|nr:hypothetical protein BDK51DRAFT_25748 [Blyttiomyces helicus]|eukprot:RKO90975.1 hypothetical protein BDK51DRAFT_25748 [Blyttiomyces helicus]